MSQYEYPNYENCPKTAEYFMLALNFTQYYIQTKFVSCSDCLKRLNI